MLGRESLSVQSDDMRNEAVSRAAEESAVVWRKESIHEVSATSFKKVHGASRTPERPELDWLPRADQEIF